MSVGLAPRIAGSSAAGAPEPVVASPVLSVTGEPPPRSPPGHPLVGVCLTPGRLTRSEQNASGSLVRPAALTGGPQLARGGRRLGQTERVP